MSKEVEEAIKRLTKAQNDIWYATLYSQEEGDKDTKTVLNYVKQLENKLADSTPNKVIREKIKDLKAKSGGNVFHIQQTINAEISLLEEILKGEKKK